MKPNESVQRGYGSPSVLAILLGASRFPQAPSVDSALLATAFAATKRAMFDYLCEISGEVLDLFDADLLPNHLGLTISEFLSTRPSASDVVVYYVGHGGYFKNQDYYLALRCTNDEHKHLTTFRFADLGNTLAEKTHLDARCFVILDCCYAGGAAQYLMQSDGVDVLELQARKMPRGIALLAAASKHEAALVPRDSSRTMFSGALLRILQEGSTGPQYGRAFSLRQLGDLCAILIADQHREASVRPQVHSPLQRDGDPAEYPFFPNRSFRFVPANSRPALAEAASGDRSNESSHTEIGLLAPALDRGANELGTSPKDFIVHPSIDTTQERPWPLETEPRRRPIGLVASVAFALLVGFSIVGLLAHGVGILVPETRLALMQQRHQNSAPLKSESLRVALIDKQTKAVFLEQLGGSKEVDGLDRRWRALYARAINRLTDAGAAVIVFDIIFEEEPKNADESAATDALANSIIRAIERNTKVVLPATRRAENGEPALATAVLAAIQSKKPWKSCIVAHPCIGEPEKGPAVPLLPLVFDDGEDRSDMESGDSHPMFALSLCAVARLRGDSMLAWARVTHQLFMTNGLAVPISFSGLERGADVSRCRIANDRTLSVHRIIAPFAEDLTRNSPRVLPMERLLDISKSIPAEWDVRNRVVLVGQRDLGDDVVIQYAAPAGRPLWGVSAHAAAIDALLQLNGLVTIIDSRWQLAWLSGLCLIAITLRVRGSRKNERRRLAYVVSLAVVDVVFCVFAARYWGFVADPGNHVIALASAWLIAGWLQAIHGVETS